MKHEITQALVRSMFYYEPCSGSLVRTQGRRAGTVAGTTTKDGYVVVGIGNRLFKAHRLIWLWVTGSWPTQLIDHVNGIKSDNRFSNLRDVSVAVNLQNSHRPRRNNKSGYLGVFKDATRPRWGAKFRGQHLGWFSTPELAHDAYSAAKRFACDNPDGA